MTDKNTAGIGLGKPAPRHHELKTDPAVFAAVLEGAKTHEIRKNDRAFAVGDELLLRETTCTGAEIAAGAPLEYTGRELERTVSHVLTGYGLQDGWCILSLARRAEPSVAADERALLVFCEAAKRAMRGYRMSNMICGEGDPCDAYPLVDLLSTEGESIATGQNEIDLIVDAIYDEARAALASPAVPEGYKLVPIKPSREMLVAALRLDLSYMPNQEAADREAVYKAMVGASPAVSQKDGAAVDDALSYNASLIRKDIKAAVDLASPAATVDAPADTTTAGTSDPYDAPLDIHRHIAKEILADRTPAPSRDASALLRKMTADTEAAWAEYCAGQKRPVEEAFIFEAGYRAALARAQQTEGMKPLPAQGEPVAQVIKGTEWGSGLAFIANGKAFPKVGTLLYAAAPAQAGDARDAARLDFIAQHEAWIAWTNDGERCRVFVRDEDGVTGPLMGWVPEAWGNNAREAIDSAMSAQSTQVSSETISQDLTREAK